MGRRKNPPLGRRATARRNRIAEANLGLAYHVARIDNSADENEIEDRESDSMLGLLSAASGFDPKRGNKFSTYAYVACQRRIKYGRQLKARASRNTEAIGKRDFAASAAPSIQPELIETLHAAIDRLPRRERLIMRMRCGLDGDGESTLDTIARKVRISKERVRQLAIECMEHLRAVLEDRFPDLKTSSADFYS